MEVFDFWEQLDNQEDREVAFLCERIGYGNVMSRASKLWAKKIESPDNANHLKGVPGSHFVVGPCAKGTVTCGCKTPHKCKWCNGSGWLTKHVKEVKDSLDKKRLDHK